MNYNDLIGNLQKQATQSDMKANATKILKDVKKATTSADLDREFEKICAAFYEVEQDIKRGSNIERQILKRTYERGADVFTYFTGHQFFLRQTSNLIEDDPIFIKLLIEIPYDIKNKAIMVAGIELEDCQLVLNYDEYSNVFVWKEATSGERLVDELLKSFIASVLNIRLLNSSKAF